MEFEVIEDAALLILMFIAFGVPALAIAARIAMRPFLEAVKHIRQHNPPPADPRVALLEAEVARLSQQVKQLADAESFARQLRGDDSSV